MIGDICRNEVKSLFLSPLFLAITSFFLFLAYGYYLLNPSVSKDCMCFQYECGWRYLFATSYMLRWGTGVYGAITGAAGQTSMFITGVIGLPIWLLGNAFIVGFFNRLIGGRNVLASSVFCVLAMTSAWYSEIFTYPNEILRFGLGTLCSAFTAIGFYDVYRNGYTSSYWYATAAFTYAISTYEIFFPMTFMVLSIALLCDSYVRNNRKFPSLRFLLMVLGAVLIALALKVLVSLAFMRIYAMIAPMDIRELFDGCATRNSWLECGFLGGFRKLVVDSFVEFGLRALIYFPAFWFTLSAVVFALFVLWSTIRSRNVMILVYGILTVVFIEFFPLFQGNLSGSLRKILPMAPLLLATEVFFCIRSWRSVSNVRLTFVGAFLILFVSNLTVSFDDVVKRYSLDKNMALDIVHDIERMVPEGDPRPIVFVGSVAHNAWRYGYADGHAWRGVTIGSPTWLEKKLGIRLDNGGFGAQGTLLDSSKGRREELYNLFTKLSRREFRQPTNDQHILAEDSVRLNNVPAYPRDGSLIMLNDMVVVNLGL